MIYSLRGILVHRSPAFAVVECGGVGYKCNTSLMTLRDLPDTGKEVMLYTYMSVREDGVELFGFSTTEERECFKMLTSVSGVGSKVGTAILSELTPEQVAVCIASEDPKSLTRASGVGNKLAQRIVRGDVPEGLKDKKIFALDMLELKDKVKKLGKGSAGVTLPTGKAAETAFGNVKNAIDALAVLGYDSADIMPIISKFDSNLKVEELIHLTLLELGKK